ncbi:dynamin family protein, partial [Virgibacillus sp. W0430]|uniref:dynamin family protein n=1 Tax=Virgibacillus sp. W0430 TaxID=3391580 RepID=UPI003F4720D7
MEKLQTKMTKDHIIALYKVLSDNNDHENAFKMLELYEKIQKQELIITFAGHFSAGKSSMINKLLDQEILPKSPIPTSANIVKICSGDEAAKVFFHNDIPIKYSAPYDIEMIKEYCKDKDTIKQIELVTENSFLPEGASLIDTPGIDAADDADRLMTESSLHLVDILFYVMDYNHVQSEVNLLFLKSLQKKGIPFYVIINQVDKHNENELPFKSFERSINQTFDQWGISPKAIYFTSLLKENAPHNQFQKLKKLLFDLLRSNKKDLMRTDASIQQIIESHERFLKQEAEEQLASYNSQSVTNSDIDKLDQLEQQIVQLKSFPKQLKDMFQEQVTITLKNAYLMPASLRDQAEGFLLSQQKGFKIGLFGSKKKTEEERQARLNTFITELQKSIESAIQWKLRDKIMQLLNENKLANPKLIESVQQLSVTYETEDLFSHLKEGAQVNGNYVLNYTNEISTDIKSKFRVKVQQLWTKIETFVQDDVQRKLEVFEEQQKQLKLAYEWKEQQDKLENELKTRLNTIENVCLNPKIDDRIVGHLEKELTQKNNTRPAEHSEHKVKHAVNNRVNDKTSQESVDKLTHRAFNSNRATVDEVMRAIDHTIATVEELPMFQEILSDLNRKRERLDQRKLTIALFGAFSAGKSSFANALLGERLLPASPNPTTAVINRISPVTPIHKHGTIVIKLKNNETLYEDLYRITKPFTPPKGNFETLLSWVKENKIYKSNDLNKMYQSYLEAMISGYEQLKDSIGNTIDITLEEFSKYVTDETKACYFEQVDLYYDCSLTKQGITLVDTPGADSVNARHTNVAFDYIKQADAILYVTYYNHALSRADKDFLMQLGRVKEAFELDKMFFIINASDLAQNDADLQLVIQYVEEQLLQLGIRFPKIFSVSSKQSLENKLIDEPLNEEMKRFEFEFYQFINEDLAK